MSSSFFILPYDAKAWEDPDDTSETPTSDLTINLEEFRAALSEHWGKDRIQEEARAWILTNTEDVEGGGLRVSLLDGNQVIAFSPGPRHILLEFILWYRRYIPASYCLYLNHSSSFKRLLLTADTTVDDIDEFTGIRR